MKCHYHPDVEAEGQCKDCGKEICGECIVEHNGICEDCYTKKNTGPAKELRDYMIDYKNTLRKSIIKACVIGTIFALVIGAFLGEYFNALIFVALFCVPAGYISMTSVFGKDPYSMEKTQLALLAASSYNSTVSGLGIGYLLWKWIKFYWKFTLSGIIGIPCFIYLIYKYIITCSRIKKMS